MCRDMAYQPLYQVVSRATCWSRCIPTLTVDFSAVARAGRSAGLALSGFTTQAEFLLATGLLELAAEIDPSDPGYPALSSEIKRLTLPAEMGEAVKVLALSRGCEARLSGFSGRDYRSRL